MTPGLRVDSAGWLAASRSKAAMVRNTSRLAGWPHLLGLTCPFKSLVMSFSPRSSTRAPILLEVVPGAIVQSSITATNVDAVRHGDFDPFGPVLAKVGGNVVVNTPTPVAGLPVDVFATIGGSLKAA